MTREELNLILERYDDDTPVYLDSAEDIKIKNGAIIYNIGTPYDLLGADNIQHINKYRVTITHIHIQQMKNINQYLNENIGMFRFIDRFKENGFYHDVYEKEILTDWGW